MRRPTVRRPPRLLGRETSWACRRHPPSGSIEQIERGSPQATSTSAIRVCPLNVDSGPSLARYAGVGRPIVSALAGAPASSPATALALSRRISVGHRRRFPPSRTEARRRPAWRGLPWAAGRPLRADASADASPSALSRGAADLISVCGRVGRRPIMSASAGASPSGDRVGRAITSASASPSRKEACRRPAWRTLDVPTPATRKAVHGRRPMSRGPPIGERISVEHSDRLGAGERIAVGLGS